MDRPAPTGPEAFFTMNDPPEVLALNFPPTETDRRSTDSYIPSDPSTLRTFLYPANVDLRDYQFDISKLCFQHNTLVCLPTGSGKTFIAAVVMMNFNRWYPTGKIIFMAPTRALVQQQIHACSSFTRIPSSQIVELMGTTTPAEARKKYWREKSVFFATPQVVKNDIEKKRLDPTSIVLLIVDEAHHAHGNYAYSLIVRMVAERSAQFRVVGLTATPGNDTMGIQSVIFSLMISRIVFKDDTDPDIAKYQHTTNVERISVPLAAEESALMLFLGKCMESLAQPLQVNGHLAVSDPKYLTRGRVWVEMEKFKKLAGVQRDFFMYMGMFSALYSLATMQEKLARYGAASLNDALKDYVKRARDTETKRRLVESPAFVQLVRLAERSKLHTHPKLARLSLILEEFYTANPESRAMIFTQLRASAYEVSEHINKLAYVKSSVFIGQADTRQNAGLGEGLQHEVVSLFRKGNINCIVATSVGEEGLDIGEVDLIVCYDTPSSPLKNVQRMGRTGRKRCGRVVFLMCEGYEEKGLEKAQNSRSFIRNRLTVDVGRFCLYNPAVPNMQLPEEPVCVKLRCVEERIIVSGPSVPDNKGALLTRNERHAMECCFGKTLRFKRVKLNPQKRQADAAIIISHSAESSILSCFSQKTDELAIPQAIEDQVSRLFAVAPSSGSSDDDDSPAVPKPPTEFMVSDSDDSDATCVPLSMHLRDDDDTPETPSTAQRNFLSSDDDDDIEIIPTPPRLHAPSRPVQIQIDSDSDDLLPPPVQKPRCFLDSDDDIDSLTP
jgi:Fanconi anemia group M protein